MKPLLGKRRTREHVIADLSVNFVERQTLLCCYTMERMHYDYGIDLEMKTYDALGQREPGDVLFQVKATEEFDARKMSQAVAWRIQRTDLVGWLREMMPVILVVFEAKRNRAYWLCIHDYFGSLDGFNLFAAGATITVQIPFGNRLNSNGIKRICRIRDKYRLKAEENK